MADRGFRWHQLRRRQHRQRDGWNAAQRHPQGRFDFEGDLDFEKIAGWND
jgi:hypothetical protein